MGSIYNFSPLSLCFDPFALSPLLSRSHENTHIVLELRVLKMGPIQEAIKITHWDYSRKWAADLSITVFPRNGEAIFHSFSAFTSALTLSSSSRLPPPPPLVLLPSSSPSSSLPLLIFSRYVSLTQSLHHTVWHEPRHLSTDFAHYSNLSWYHLKILHLPIW